MKPTKQPNAGNFFSKHKLIKDNTLTLAQKKRPAPRPMKNGGPSLWGLLSQFDGWETIIESLPDKPLSSQPEQIHISMEDELYAAIGLERLHSSMPKPPGK